MIVVSTNDVAGREIAETLGLVRGSTVRARHIGRDLLAVFRTIVGGEVDDYTKMLAEAREQALDRMTAEAQKLGADAVLAVRFSTTQTMQSAAEILVLWHGRAAEVTPTRIIRS